MGHFYSLILYFKELHDGSISITKYVIYLNPQIHNELIEEFDKKWNIKHITDKIELAS